MTTYITSIETLEQGLYTVYAPDIATYNPATDTNLHKATKISRADIAEYGYHSVNKTVLLVNVPEESDVSTFARAMVINANKTKLNLLMDSDGYVRGSHQNRAIALKASALGISSLTQSRRHTPAFGDIECIDECVYVYDINNGADYRKVMDIVNKHHCVISTSTSSIQLNSNLVTKELIDEIKAKVPNVGIELRVVESKNKTHAVAIATALEMDYV